MNNKYKQLRCSKCNKLLLTFKGDNNISTKCNRCKSYIDLKIKDDKIEINNGGSIK